MKKLKMPSHYATVEPPDQRTSCGGGGLFSGAIGAAASFLFPEEKIAGESRGGYYPTFILVPEAIFLDYAALRVSNFLFRAAALFASLGL